MPRTAGLRIDDCDPERRVGPGRCGDPNPVVIYPLTWVFTIENTGEVDIDGIIVDENRRGARARRGPRTRRTG